jgi:hypothetical protein
VTLFIAGLRRRRFKLCREPQTSVSDTTAALPLAVTKRIELGSELGHREGLVVVHRTPNLVRTAKSDEAGTPMALGKNGENSAHRTRPTSRAMQPSVQAQKGARWPMEWERHDHRPHFEI